MRRAPLLLVAVLSGIALAPAVCLAGDVVAIVSAKSAVTTLTRAQVADLFLGKTLRYPDGSPALPLDQRDGTAVRDAFYADYAAKSPAQVRAYWAKLIFTGRGQPPQTLADSTEVKRRVAENPQAIGYVETRFVDETVRVVGSE